MAPFDRPVAYNNIKVEVEVEFLLVSHFNYDRILYHFRNKVRYWTLLYSGVTLSNPVP